jgi:hypothetical protein
VIEFLRTFEHGFSIDGVKFLLPSGSQEIGLGVVMALILILRPTGLTRSREIGAPHELARRSRRRAASPSPVSRFRTRLISIGRVKRRKAHDHNPVNPPTCFAVH